MANVTADFTTNVAAIDPLAVGITLSGYNGNGNASILNSTWKASLQALAPASCRVPFAWFGGNPGIGAGGGQTPGNATAYLNAINAIGAIPYVIYLGDTSDNGGINSTTATSFVNWFNAGGGAHGGPVKYWVVGNEPDNTGGTGPYESVVGGIVSAIHAADATTKVSAPAAAYWDTGLMTNSSITGSGLNIMSWHEYDGGNTDGTGFPTDPQYSSHTKSALGFVSGTSAGVEEINWSPFYGSGNTTQFYDWHNTLFLADAAGQILSAGGHMIMYADSNGALGLMNDGTSNNAQPGSYGTKFPAYWGIGIWTGMNGQFKRWNTHMVTAATTFAQGVLTAYACDNGKIVICNKGSSAQNLTIAVTLSGGATTGTFKVWTTNAASPLSAISNTANGSFTGGVISYTIPGQTAASIDVTAAASSPGVLLVNDFEEGSTGVTLTAANTAGTNENAFDAVTIDATCAATFSGAHPGHGLLSGLFSTGATAGRASVTWSTSLGTQTVIYGRSYVRLTANPATADAIWQHRLSGTTSCNIQITNFGQLLIQDAAFTPIHQFTAVIPIGQYVRVEWKITFSATAGQITVSYYAAPDSATATEIYTSPATQNFGTGANSVDIGWTNAHAGQPALYLDDIGISNTGPLGPVAAGPRPLLVSIASRAGTDDHGNPYPQGLNVSQGTLAGSTFKGTDFEINPAGAFFYSGTPAAGNLVASVSRTQGTDAHGNAYLTGIVSYGPDTFSGTGFIATQIWQGDISWYHAATEAGPWTAEAIAGWNDAGLLLQTASSPVEIEALGSSVNIPSPLFQALVALQPGTTATSETWHTVSSLPAGWTATGAGVRYRLMPDNSVRIQVSASIGPTAASGTVNIVTLGTGYVPSNPFRGCAPGIFTGNTAWQTGIVNSRLQVTTGGVVQFLNFPGGSSTGITEVDGQWDVPLD